MFWYRGTHSEFVPSRESGSDDCFYSFWGILSSSSPIYLQRHPPRCCLTNNVVRQL